MLATKIKRVPAIWMVSCLAASLLGAAVSDSDYVTFMKAAAGACGRAKKNVEAKANAADLAKDAAEMATNFKKIQAYWKAKKADDAVTAAKDAAAASNLLAKAAKAGDMAAAETHFKAVTATCGGCHKAHREKGGDGAWKIK